MSVNLKAQAQEQENDAIVEDSQTTNESRQDVDKLFARMKSAEEEKKELKALLQGLTQKEKDREQAKLAEEGKFKELLETKEKELQEVLNKADKVDALNSVVQAMYEKKLESIPEDKRGMIPYQDDPIKALEYINQWESQLIPQGVKGITSPNTPKNTLNPADDNEVAKARHMALKDKLSKGNMLSDSEMTEFVRLGEKVGRQ